MIARLKEGSQLKVHVSLLLSRKEQSLNLRCSQLSLTTVHGSSVQALLRTAESSKMLDHSRNFLALQALDIVIPNLAGQESVLRERFFNLKGK